MPAKGRALLTGLMLGLTLVACGLLAGCGGGGGGAGGVATVYGVLADDSTLAGVSGGIVTIAGRTSSPSAVDGSFEVDNVPTGSQSLTVTLTGYQTVAASTSLVSGPNTLSTIYLKPGLVSGDGNITGTVQSSGSAVAGATVTAGGKTAYTKDDGSFTVYNLAPGNVTVRASSGAMSGLGVATVTSGGTADITISVGIGPPPPPI